MPAHAFFFQGAEIDRFPFDSDPLAEHSRYGIASAEHLEGAQTETGGLILHQNIADVPAMGQL